jgi:hypothetical protein
MSAKVKIDGIEYDFPGIDTLTLDEAVVLYEQSGLTLDQIGELPTDSFHPGFIKGMLFIAVQRSRPELKRDEISKRLGELKISDMGEVFEQQVEEDAGPPESEPSEPLEPSGETGDDGSEIVPPEPAIPDSSGTLDSDDSSVSDRVTSAA